MDTMKLLVVGYQKTGKTAILQSVNGNIDHEFRTYNVDFETRDNGNLRFLCSEASEIVITDICSYDGVMVVFDVMQMQSYKYMKILCEELTRVDLNKPIVIVQNKCDRPKWKVKNIVADRYFDLPIYKISASAKKKMFKSLSNVLLD
ncbi:hypothetical protein MKX03_014805 [Papaver bracteatum]|nr:hypothetical protein MKX03_014805 [Papaver bracteatum]